MGYEMNKALEDFYSSILGESASKNHTPLLSATPDAKPLYVVTGASFTPYDPDVYGQENAQAVFENARGEKFLMNTGAATLMRLIENGDTVVVHGTSPTTICRALDLADDTPAVKIVGGDLTTQEDTRALVDAIRKSAAEQPVSEVRLMAYQSFAQNNGSPFKPMHEESVQEVDRAALRRIRFSFNMAAVGYWLLDAENQPQLRVVVMSALAANRSSYGLVADAADKFMNENCWRTFHLEANYLTGKSVNVTQVNPGITNACGVYQGSDMRDFLMDESIADGHPMAENVRTDPKALPQLSSRDVAEVVFRALTTPDGADMNKDLPDPVKQALFGGYTPDQLKAIFNRTVQEKDGRIEFAVDQPGPQHLYAAYTTYGALPTIKPNGYQRISLTPPGQTF